MLALLAGMIYAGVRMAPAGFDPLELAEIGPRFAELDPAAEPGYDGQFTLFIALDPDPESVAPHLDVPAYRYQRILLPIAARLLALGQPAAIPWMLLIVNLAALLLGTRVLTGLLLDRGHAPGYALIYGLWVGIIAPVGLDLHEPLAYALVIVAFYLTDRGRVLPAAFAAALALFAKETTLPFWLAMLLAEPGRGWTRSRTWLVGGGLAFMAWQGWLWMTFGAPGIGSGGDLATGFELIPYMGLWRIGVHGWRVLLLFAIILLPTIVLPSVWGFISTTRKMLRERSFAGDTLALWMNSSLIAFTPHSTFREPLGIVRLADGLVLGLILFSTRFHKKHVLNYSFFWIALLFLLVQQN
jgi:hypothetical protein